MEPPAAKSSKIPEIKQTPFITKHLMPEIGVRCFCICQNVTGCLSLFGRSSPQSFACCPNPRGLHGFYQGVGCGASPFLFCCKSPRQTILLPFEYTPLLFCRETHRIGQFICCARGTSLCPFQTPSPAHLTRFTARCLFLMLIPLSAQPSITIFFFYKTKRLQQNTFLLCALLRESSILKNT